MPRNEYLNVRLTKARLEQLSILCAELHIDPATRGALSQALDHALRQATPGSILELTISEATKAKLDTLATQYNTQTEVVAVAIDRLFLDEIELRAPIHMYTTDRVAQVNWLQELAGDIAAYSGAESPSQAIDHWIKGLKRDNQLPVWFDYHDHNLLVEYVREKL